MWEALSRLPLRQHLALFLKDIGGHSYREIAEILETSEPWRPSCSGPMTPVESSAGNAASRPIAESVVMPGKGDSNNQET